MGHDQLIGLPVVNTSRKRLGKIIGFRFDPESQSILQYDVKSGLLGKSLVIHRSQVLTITEHSMVVDDMLVAEEENKEVKASEVAKEEAAVLSQEID